MRHFRIPAFLLLFCFHNISGQDNLKVITLNGYLSGMQMVMFQDIDEDWMTENMFHNRLNLYFYPLKNFSASVQLRNRFIYGETVNNTPGYKDMINSSNGWADLSFNIFTGDYFVLNTAIDRLWIQYTAGNFEATAGRQRINWGQTLVWNPNDIFNVYSYFDIDYIERPGSDAIRLKYYTSYTSSIELTAKTDSSEKITAAGLFHFNIRGYDIQFLGGILEEKDLTAGLGWSGNISNAGFRGEVSYFHDIDNFKDTTGLIMVSTGMEYTFKNSLLWQIEFLYSNRPFMPDEGFLGYYTSPLNVKSLAFTKYSLFTSINYSFTPLFNCSFAGMYFPKLSGFFTGPSITYNMMENVDLSMFLQYFSGEMTDPLTLDKKREDITIAFLRLRWNF
ncbi:MAG: hypothetical protein AMS27_06490 [Bacteroides sp. SM23_62_1]|nr:MAG: hypothetical protein AMS27_06490 [Bacteroides sp. SM23_62_1]